MLLYTTPRRDTMLLHTTPRHATEALHTTPRHHAAVHHYYGTPHTHPLTPYFY